MKNKKLKILAAGDLHGDTNLAEKLAEQAKKENVDLVVLCGDISYFDQKTENMIGPFVRRDEKVLIIPGNHETLATHDFLTELYKLKDLHGYSARYNDVGIFGCGGSNIGPNTQLTEKESYDLLKKGFEKIEYLKKKIMVTHTPPSGSKMEKFVNASNVGSTGVRRAIDMFKPDIVLCSHIHSADGVEEMIGNTKVINVGTKGKIIEL